MVEPTWSRAVWRKSRRSGGNSDCVECAVVGERVGVRDSHDPHGPVLVFGPAAWKAFIDAVKHDEFGPAGGPGRMSWSRLSESNRRPVLTDP